jgi:hypothetical protein
MKIKLVAGSAGTTACIALLIFTAACSKALEQKQEAKQRPPPKASVPEEKVSAAVKAKSLGPKPGPQQLDSRPPELPFREQNLATQPVTA